MRARIIKTIRFLLLAFLIITALFGILLLSGHSYNISSMREPMENMLGSMLGRQVSISGPMFFQSDLTPRIDIDDIAISNPEHFGKGNFATIGHLGVEVGALELFTGRLRIVDAVVGGLDMKMVSSVDGRSNWYFESEEAGRSPSGNGTLVKLLGRRDAKILDIEQIRLQRIKISYHDLKSGFSDSILLKNGNCTGRPGKPFVIDLRGKVKEEPYILEIKAASLAELFDEERAWMSIGLDVAGTELDFMGGVRFPLRKMVAGLKVKVKGSDLSSLNRLAGVSLPPLGPYEVNGIMGVSGRNIYLPHFDLRVGRSVMNGTLEIDRSSKIPDIKASLGSSLIRIDDFRPDGWKMIRSADMSVNSTEPTKPCLQVDVNIGGERMRHVLSPEVLSRFNAKLDIRADMVTSGKDELGKGKASFAVKGKRVTLDPFHLSIPGGTIDLMCSLRLGKKSSEGRLKAFVSRFDYGITARRIDPQTDMSGLLNLDVDLRSKNRYSTRLAATANGHFDFAVKPRNYEAGVIDLWASNLLMAILPNFGVDKSMINCVVGDFEVKDGVMRPKKLIVDTGKIRIAGTGEVDLRNETVDLTLAPKAKSPTFFTLETPVNVSGSFSDFGVGVTAEDVALSVVNFAISPLTESFRYLFMKDLPSDGHDICPFDK